MWSSSLPYCLSGSLTYDLDADAAGPDVELLYAHDNPGNAGIAENERGYPLRKSLDETDMFDGDDHCNAVGHHVVRQYVAHVLGNMVKTFDVDVDVEAPGPALIE